MFGIMIIGFFHRDLDKVTFNFFNLLNYIKFLALQRQLSRLMFMYLNSKYRKFSVCKTFIQSLEIGYIKVQVS